MIFHLESGQYYSLNEVGGRVWSLCDGTRTATDIAATMRDEFDTSAEEIRQDVFELLEALAAEGLVTESAEANGGVADAANAG